jgi:hypothetical protein
MPIKKIAAALSIISILTIAFFVTLSSNQAVSADQTLSPGYKSMAVSFQDTKDVINSSQRITASETVIAQYFGKDVVDKILAQSGCVGVRMYYGIRTNGKPGVIILGVDKYGKDIVTGVLASPTFYCPPFCGS